MNQSVMIGLYRPGDTILHRLPVAAKLLGLAALSVAIVLVRGPESAVIFLALTIAAAAVGGVPGRTLLRQTRGVLMIAVVVGAFQWWLSGPARAVESLLDLVSLTLAALVVTATTPVNAMIDAMVSGCRLVPFVNADRVALLLALAIRAVPASIELASQTRDAAIARGLERHPKAFLSPFVVRIVANAQQTGDALAARGIDSD